MLPISSLILPAASLAVSALLIWFIKNTVLPFGTASRCPKKKTIRLKDGSEVLLVAPDPNMTIGMVDSEARNYGYAVVGKSVLESAVAPVYKARKRRSYVRVMARDPDGSVWAFDAHDNRLGMISHLSECDGCLVAIALIADEKAPKPAPVAA